MLVISVEISSTFSLAYHSRITSGKLPFIGFLKSSNRSFSEFICVSTSGAKLLPTYLDFKPVTDLRNYNYESNQQDATIQVNSFIDTNLIQNFLYKLHKIKFLYMFRVSSAHLQEVNDVNCTCMQPLVFSFCKSE